MAKSNAADSLKRFKMRRVASNTWTIHKVSQVTFTRTRFPIDTVSWHRNRIENDTVSKCSHGAHLTVFQVFHFWRSIWGRVNERRKCIESDASENEIASIKTVPQVKVIFAFVFILEGDFPMMIISSYHFGVRKGPFLPYSVEICHKIRHFLSISATIVAAF